MDEAHAAMSTGWPADSMRQATTSMGTDQSSTNDADVDQWENEGGTVLAPAPAGSSIAKDAHRCRHVRLTTKRPPPERGSCSSTEECVLSSLINQ